VTEKQKDGQAAALALFNYMLPLTCFRRTTLYQLQLFLFTTSALVLKSSICN